MKIIDSKGTEWIQKIAFTSVYFYSNNFFSSLLPRMICYFNCF